MSRFDLVPIGQLVSPVRNWTPEREVPGGIFTYIDLGAVDQGTKQITGQRRLLGADAPSRARQIVTSGDILVSTVRPNLNAVARVGDELNGATASTGFCVLSPNADGLDSGYLFHWVRSDAFISEMVKRATGASYPAVSDRIVRESLLPLPTISEQRRIADILDRADALRAKRRAAIAQLDTLTQAVFLDMFGDPATNPRGWPVRAVSDYVEQLEGGKSVDPNADEEVVARHRVLKISAVTTMSFQPSESKPVPNSYEPRREHFVRDGDLLFSRANTSELVGAVAYVREPPSNLLLPDKLWRFVWRRPELVEPLFIWALFQTAAIRQKIGRRATGTSGSMKNISQEKLLGIQTIVPPMSLQRRFVQREESIEKLKSTCNLAAAELTRLFVSLQHRAFRGDL